MPLFLAAHGADAASVGLVAGIYPAVWGAGQIWTGHWSDRIGRKPLIVAGMLIQATALVVLAASGGVVAVAAVTAVLLGVGTALVYPTLIAAISNAVSPVARAPMVGVYRFWCTWGTSAAASSRASWRTPSATARAIAGVASLTAMSALWVLFDMPGRSTVARTA